ncbi:uncharacterized protein K441DRAFT_559814, partial [Cenococcum geophilum 1.58]|uniref:uncharacterized protein n=1 Tax=Cenococcum geophilum 1.58 TaxID=794803 RepID=UPI00358F2EFA
ININKFKFYSTKTKYLGLIISTNSITINPKKRHVPVVYSLHNPRGLTSLRILFLGFANFYRRFIYNYSDVA